MGQKIGSPKPHLENCSPSRHHLGPSKHSETISDLKPYLINGRRTDSRFHGTDWSEYKSIQSDSYPEQRHH